MSNRYASILCFMPFFVAQVSHAGAPFLTNDPNPGQRDLFMVYVYANMFDTTIEEYEPFLKAPVVEFDWTPIKNLQLSIAFPMAWATVTANSNKGFGDIDLGLTYRFIEESEYMPEFAIAPGMTLPTGNAKRDLGNGKSEYNIPIWLQKNWGPWTVYGGGGWAFNSEPGNTNYPFGGMVVERQITDKLRLGLESFSQGAETPNGEYTVILNAGGSYRFTDALTFMLSAGHSIAGLDSTVAYLGFFWTNQVKPKG